MVNVCLIVPKGSFSKSFINAKRSFSTTCNLLKEDEKDSNLKPASSKKVHALPIPYEKSEIMKFAQRSDRIMVDRHVDISLITGVPEEHIKERLVRISKAPKSAMQSGTDNTHAWVMQFDTHQRWENPLMGWCSSGDPLSNLQIRFHTAQEAQEFCDKNSWEWYMEKEKPVQSKVKSYGHNFSWNKRTRVSTK